MTEASKWRYELAERIAASYMENPKTRVVMVAGSVGRGCADRYSDLEIDVYYDEAPTEADRIAAVEGCGAVLEGLNEDAYEWEEQMSLDGFHAATSTFLVATMEGYLSEVVDRCEVAPDGQTRLYSLQHGVPLMGHDLVAQWRDKAAQYPDGLVVTMLEAHLLFRGFWYAEEMLAARDDVLALCDIFVRVEQQILGALLGLNRLYVPTPDYMKRMDEMIGGMQIKPVDLSRRLKQAFRMPPQDGVDELKAVISEVIDLVEVHLPNFDTAPYRANFNARRQVWDVPPKARSG
ncbi:MAG: hypothetical protein O7G87_09110 [bacterium]|nr:hypothetical protein [bacterium]